MRYRERLLPGPGVWLILVGLGVGLGLIIVPLGPAVALGVAVLASVALVVLGWLSAAVVEVTDRELHAGRARIGLDLVSEVEALDAASMRRATGPGLDARAYLCLRGWVRTGARITITDPSDPAPYWLLSTRHPEALARAVGTYRV